VKKWLLFMLLMLSQFSFVASILKDLQETNKIFFLKPTPDVLTKDYPMTTLFATS
jgi:hypothetical protein